MGILRKVAVVSRTSKPTSSKLAPRLEIQEAYNIKLLPFA